MVETEELEDMREKQTFEEELGMKTSHFILALTLIGAGTVIAVTALTNGGGK